MDAPIREPGHVVNALTIDVEDYFQVSAFAPYVHRSTWDSRAHRIERNIDVILEILDLADTQATFFTLGWIAERYPQVARQIVAQGHELASHGYAHDRATELKPTAFSADVALAKTILEDVTGIAVTGYRAPSFSIGAANRWAYDCLAEAGYRYSSSTYPIAHDHYGDPNGKRFAHDVGGGLLEVPVTTARLMRRNWPAGGGGYFRLMPYAVSRWLIRRVNAEDGEAAIFYFHPWEIDPEQPRVPGANARTRFRHYVNLRHTSSRLKMLLRDFRWDRMDRRRAGQAMNSRAEAIISGSVEAPPIRVRPMKADDRTRWDEFVMRCPDATFFHRSGWKALLEHCFGHRTHYLLAERSSDVVGVLPLAEVKSLIFGHALVSLPFCAYGGVAATDPGAVAALHSSARELGKRLGVAHLELRDRAQRETDWPQQSLYVTFRKEILPEVEANMLAIPRKQRAVVRKGIKNGLTSHIDADVDRFFALYADNMHRHGTPPLSRRYFERLQATFGRDAEVLTITDAGGKPVSSVFSFYFRDEVLPYYAGDDTVARDLGANDFKYWELMRRACERGIRIFDYGRSKQGTGPFDFKKNWGFEPTPLAYEYCLYRRDRIPENNPLNPKYRAMIALWRRLPLPVVNLLGPHVVKGLG